MTFFFLLKQHHRTLEDLPDGRFYERDDSSIVQVPHVCAPVWCAYSGDWTKEGHSWTNPRSGTVYTTHPLCFTVESDSSSFFDGFYEITTIDGLTFREGEAWCPDTNSKIPVEKTDPLSIWNPFFQRYDPPCNKNLDTCFPKTKRITYNHETDDFHELFSNNMKMFLDTYCPCCVCCECQKISSWCRCTNV